MSTQQTIEHRKSPALRAICEVWRREFDLSCPITADGEALAVAYGKVMDGRRTSAWCSTIQAQGGWKAPELRAFAGQALKGDEHPVSGFSKGKQSDHQLQAVILLAAEIGRSSAGAEAPRREELVTVHALTLLSALACKSKGKPSRGRLRAIERNYGADLRAWVTLQDSRWKALELPRVESALRVVHDILEAGAELAAEILGLRREFDAGDAVGSLDRVARELDLCQQLIVELRWLLAREELAQRTRKVGRWLPGGYQDSNFTIARLTIARKVKGKLNEGGALLDFLRLFAQDAQGRGFAARIRGPAGVGKSTLARRLVHEFRRPCEFIAVYVELNAWMTSEDAESRGDLLQFGLSALGVSATVRTQLMALAGERLSQVSEAQPGIVLLLDGWDELGVQRSDAVELLERYLGEHPRVSAVVLGRDHEGIECNNDFAQGRRMADNSLTLVGLKRDQQLDIFARTLVASWNAADSSAHSGPLVEHARYAEATRVGEGLLPQASKTDDGGPIVGEDAWPSLFERPLYVVMLAWVYHEQARRSPSSAATSEVMASMPGSEAELVSQAIDVLLVGRHRREGQLEPEDERSRRAQLRRLLARLSLCLYGHGEASQWTRAELKRWLSSDASVHPFGVEAWAGDEGDLLALSGLRRDFEDWAAAERADRAVEKLLSTFEASQLLSGEQQAERGQGSELRLAFPHRRFLELLVGEGMLLAEPQALNCWLRRRFDVDARVEAEGELEGEDRFVHRERRAAIVRALPSHGLSSFPSPEADPRARYNHCVLWEAFDAQIQLVRWRAPLLLAARLAAGDGARRGALGRLVKTMNHVDESTLASPLARLAIFAASPTEPELTLEGLANMPVTRADHGDALIDVLRQVECSRQSECVRRWQDKIRYAGERLAHTQLEAAEDVDGPVFFDDFWNERSERFGQACVMYALEESFHCDDIRHGRETEGLRALWSSCFESLGLAAKRSETRAWPSALDALEGIDRDELKLGYPDGHEDLELARSQPEFLPRPQRDHSSLADYALMEYPVTMLEYSEFDRETVRIALRAAMRVGWLPGESLRDEELLARYGGLPMVGVSYYEARMYARWVHWSQAVQGDGHRLYWIDLQTEAQHEGALRADMRRHAACYPGDEAGLESSVPHVELLKACGIRYRGPSSLREAYWLQPVERPEGLPADTPWGRRAEWKHAHLRGLVNEWCVDPYEAGESPIEVGESGLLDARHRPCGLRANRGGGGDSNAGELCLACRNGGQPSGRDIFLGLRLAARARA